MSDWENPPKLSAAEELEAKLNALNPRDATLHATMMSVLCAADKKVNEPKFLAELFFGLLTMVRHASECQLLDQLVEWTKEAQERAPETVTTEALLHDMGVTKRLIAKRAIKIGEDVAKLSQLLEQGRSANG